METTEILKELTSLCHLDIDAIHAYDQALKHVDVTHIKTQLTGFRDDHHRHVKDLSEIIRRLGGQPPSFSPDFKGFLIQGMTSARSMTGTEGALKAMKTNEQLTNRNYNKAAGMAFPSDIKTVVERGLADERRHLATIEQWIQTSAWEQPGAQP
jgi:rubrerythrin